jgi:hypothetical protein
MGRFSCTARQNIERHCPWEIPSIGSILKGSIFCKIIKKLKLVECKNKR